MYVNIDDYMNSTKNLSQNSYHHVTMYVPYTYIVSTSVVEQMDCFSKIVPTGPNLKDLKLSLCKCANSVYVQTWGN